VLPAAWHHVERYASNRLEADHAQLKRRLRPMRGNKTMTGLCVLAAGHAFVQNLRRCHYEIAADVPMPLRLAAAFREQALAIWVRLGREHRSACTAIDQRNKPAGTVLQPSGGGDEPRSLA
jgi:DDE domain